MSYTLIIIIFTALVSISAFSNHDIIDKMIMWPRRINQNREYYRFLSNGFIHADYQHLIFNMITLYFFGKGVEMVTEQVAGKYLYFLLYLSAIIVSSLPSYVKHRHNSYYRSLGASGGVAAILFAYIYYDPWAMINFIIPAFLFAIIYLVLSVYLSRRGGDNIAHDAHFFGAVYGFAFAWAIDPTHGQLFIRQLLNPPF